MSLSLHRNSHLLNFHHNTQHHLDLETFLSKIISLNKISKEARNIILANNVYFLGLGLGEFFLNVFLIRQADNFSQVVIFNLVQFPAIFLGFLIGAFTPIPFKAKQFLQIGIGLGIISFLALIMLQAAVIRYVIPLGILYGLGTGFYWAGNYLLSYVNTTDKNRDSYYGLNFSISSTLSVVIPLISGLIISQKFFTDSVIINYYLLFLITIIILIISSFYTANLPNFTIPKVKPQKLLAPFKLKIWRLVGLSTFMEGIKAGSEGFIASLLLFTILTQELDMGLYQSVFSLLGAVVGLIIAKKLHSQGRVPAIILGGGLFIIAHLAFINFFSVQGILISMLILLIASPLYNIAISSVFFDILDHTKNHQQDMNEYLLFKELFSLLGCFVGALIFLIFLRFGGALEAAKAWYLFLGFIPISYGIIIYFIKKQLNHLAVGR